MARVLTYTTPATGHVLPCMAVVRELHRRGHDVHVRTREPEVAQLRELGVPAQPIDPRIDDIEFDDWRGRNSIDALNRLQRTFARRAVLEVPDLQTAIEETGPDALLVDAGAQGAGLVAEASGLPWAQLCPHPPVFGSRDTPPYGLGLRPGGSLARARDRVSRVAGRWLADRHLPPLNQMRAAHGLAPLAHLEEVFLRATRCIITTAEPYEYPRSDWPANVRLVGPVGWAPPSEPPTWLTGEARPVVLVTASTVRQADEKLITTALDALALEDVAVVVTTGAHDPAGFAPTPNAHVERFVPHGPIIERAACVVSHGGQGITQRALSAGVPVCVVPFCRDQFEVARRVEVAGAGSRLHHARLNPRRLRAAVFDAMSKRAGAERVAAEFAGAGGAEAAADAVEELVPSTDTPRPATRR